MHFSESESNHAKILLIPSLSCTYTQTCDCTFYDLVVIVVIDIILMYKVRILMNKVSICMSTLS